MIVTLTFSNCIDVEFFVTNGDKEYDISSDSAIKNVKIPDCNFEDIIALRHNSAELINLEDIHINYISFKNLIVDDPEFWKVVDNTDQLVGDRIVTIGSPDKCILKIPDQLYERYLNKLSNAYNLYNYMIRPFD
tara:strand:- start:58 stop:459 length:402 start_codon:yes stop_codon:yes gene_type:complete